MHKDIDERKLEKNNFYLDIQTGDLYYFINFDDRGNAMATRDGKDHCGPFTPSITEKWKKIADPLRYLETLKSNTSTIHKIFSQLEEEARSECLKQERLASENLGGRGPSDDEASYQENMNRGLGSDNF